LAGGTPEHRGARRARRVRGERLTTPVPSGRLAGGTHQLRWRPCLPAAVRAFLDARAHSADGALALGSAPVRPDGFGAPVAGRESAATCRRRLAENSGRVRRSRAYEEPRRSGAAPRGPRDWAQALCGAPPAAARGQSIRGCGRVAPGPTNRRAALLDQPPDAPSHPSVEQPPSRDGWPLADHIWERHRRRRPNGGRLAAALRGANAAVVARASVGGLVLQIAAAGGLRSGAYRVFTCKRTILVNSSVKSLRTGLDG